MPRRTKAEYEAQLREKVVVHLRNVEAELREAYRGFLEVGPKSVAEDFGNSWARIIKSIEDDIQSFSVGLVRINSREFLRGKIGGDR